MKSNMKSNMKYAKKSNIVSENSPLGILNSMEKSEKIARKTFLDGTFIMLGKFENAGMNLFERLDQLDLDHKDITDCMEKIDEAINSVQDLLNAHKKNK